MYDNFKGHTTKKVIDYINGELPLVEVLLLPPNTTSILQPLDVGINKPFKNYIKNKYADWLIEYFDNHRTIPKLAKRNKLFVNWISESWDNINNKIIRNSFKFPGYDVFGIKDPGWKEFYHIQK